MDPLSSGAWRRPKITPYRLTFMLTTAGLGIGKAVLVSRNQTVSSTTFEWITGVVVALIFQFMSSYEYRDRRPRYVDWLFSFDCLEPSRRPALRSQSTSQTQSEQLPFVTAYRLLVSGAFTVCGLAKMFCGYLGLSTAMNVLDWVIAIPLTLGLYYVGLYEENESSLPRRFFDVDYSPQTTLSAQTGLFLIIYLGGITLCIFWFRSWLAPLRSALIYHTASSSSESSQWENSAWNAVLEHAVKWTAVSFCLAMLEIGVLGMGFSLWPILKACSGKFASTIRYYILLACFLTLYFFVFILCLYAFIIPVSVSVPISLLSLKPQVDTDLPLPMRVLLPFIMLSSTIISGVPVVFVSIKFRAMLRVFRRTFSVSL